MLSCGESSGEVSKAFAFGGENRQIALLESEGIQFIDGKVDMNNYHWKCITMEMLKQL